MRLGLRKNALTKSSGRLAPAAGQNLLSRALQVGGRRTSPRTQRSGVCARYLGGYPGSWVDVGLLDNNTLEMGNV